MGACKNPVKKTAASESCILHLGKHKKVPTISDTYTGPSLSRREGEQLRDKRARVSPANVSRLWSHKHLISQDSDGTSPTTCLQGSGIQQTSKCFLRATGFAPSLGKLPWGSLFLLPLPNWLSLWWLGVTFKSPHLRWTCILHPHSLHSVTLSRDNPTLSLCNTKPRQSWPFDSDGNAVGLRHVSVFATSTQRPVLWFCLFSVTEPQSQEEASFLF